MKQFHPVVASWFSGSFSAPSDCQARGWPHIMAGEDTLVVAPTGSGKTLAAFLVAIDGLFRQAEAGELADAVQVIYISPLKALSNDIQRNLAGPLERMAELASDMGIPMPRVRTALRTGDTPPSERQKMLRKPPHILITTPESLYLLLTAERSRSMLRTARTVIVDELHSLQRDKRGSHLALTLARLDHVCQRRPARIGLSATVCPLSAAARFLVGGDRCDDEGAPRCAVVDCGHQRDLDLAIEVPPTELEAVCSNEQWAAIYDRIAELSEDCRTTLVFVNTRRVAERVALRLGERLGEGRVAAHHGSMSKDRRLELEDRLKAGALQVLVATASLELGIDVGAVDLVCQVESPRRISTFLQRVGRSGHAAGRRSHGRLFPTSRDELVECAALCAAVNAGRLDPSQPPSAPLDILAQQVVAECSCEVWSQKRLLELVRRAAPYADLAEETFEALVGMLSCGVSLALGRSTALLHRDRLEGTLRGRRGSRMRAIECGGAIPDLADYRVLKEPDDTFVGTLDEDFAVESMAGDVFILGTTSWRILRVERGGVVRVADAQGARPSIPFWRGEAPARSQELSQEVSALRSRLVGDLESGDDSGVWLRRECSLSAEGALQVVAYVRAQLESTGVVPGCRDLVMERFFDESGGMQVVLHSPLGGRINRALGLVMRKRFCRTFDFELQAAASDDAVLLSLGAQHAFPLESTSGLLSAAGARKAIEAALLAAPLFTTRWRWNVTRALVLARRRRGKRVPPPILRMRADDMLASVFPAQTGCQDNRTGPIDIPDHPLVNQTVHDCLHEAMDVEGLGEVLEKVAGGEVRLHFRDTCAPSPFSHEILNSRPYTFLDDAPLEERRARAVSVRRGLPPSARDLGRLDEEAIDLARQGAWPDPRDAEEVHDALLSLVVVRTSDAPSWSGWCADLVKAGRAASVTTREGVRLWFAAERLAAVELLWPACRVEPGLELPAELRVESRSVHQLAKDVVRGHLESLGPVSEEEVAERTALSVGVVRVAVASLEGEGVVLRGHFAQLDGPQEVCERRLLSRIHRDTLDRLRQAIKPVSKEDFARFLLSWQHVSPDARLVGRAGLLEVITQLQGYELPALDWERQVLAARVQGYRKEWLDELCLGGEVIWGRLRCPRGRGHGAPRAAGASRQTPMTLGRRRDLPFLLAARTVLDAERSLAPGGVAAQLLDLLKERGALFLEDLVASSHRLKAEVEEALRELVACGLVSADGFAALRGLVDSGRRRRRAGRGRSLQIASEPLSMAGGRWGCLRVGEAEGGVEPEALACWWARQLLHRWGVVFRDLMARETVLPPWRDVLRALRDLEIRGEIRGGRFVSGVYGEQFALPEAVVALRAMRARPGAGEEVAVGSGDPLNLVGIITHGGRVPVGHAVNVVWREGLAEPHSAGKVRGGVHDTAAH